MIFGLVTKNENFRSVVRRALELSPSELKAGIEKLERLYEESTGQSPMFKNDFTLKKNRYGDELIWYRDVQEFHRELKRNGWEKHQSE